MTLETADDEAGDVVQRALNTIRTHLGMEVAYLSEFVDGDSVFRRVDAPGFEDLIKPGDKRSLDEVYCRHILAGRLPELIPDTADEPLAVAMPITNAVPIGAHMSLPVRLSDGSVYGMFCCLSPRPNPGLNPRDLATMKLFADLATRQVETEILASREHRLIERRIRAMLDDRRFFPVYQPIVDLRTGRPLGYESLSRFDSPKARTPDVWFTEAFAVGRGPELEKAAIAEALKALSALPEGQYLSFNASPATVATEDFGNFIADYPLDRIALEITEHAPVECYEALGAILSPLRGRGLRLAIDDAGAGHSSLRHIVQLRPDIVKIDMSLTRDVDTDLARRALIGALHFYSGETDATIVAEGIETQAEYETLRTLGVHKGQGYYLARPDRALPSSETARALPA